MSPAFSRFLATPIEGLKPSNFTASNAFTGNDTTELNHFFFTSEDEKTLAGVWQCAPCKEVFDAYPVSEMMTILEGSVTVSDLDGGSAEVFTAGDTFFIAKDTPCIWEITETLKKYYFIAE